MKKDLTEIIFILDRSGSMSGLERDTIGGYNSFLEAQRKVEGQAQITTILFDDKYEVLHDGVNIKDIQPITAKEYFARGSTALLGLVIRFANYFPYWSNINIKNYWNKQGALRRIYG